MFPGIVSLLLCASFCAAEAGKKEVAKEPAQPAIERKKVPDGADPFAVVPRRVYRIVDALGAPIPKATVVVSVLQNSPPGVPNPSGDDASRTINGLSDDGGLVAIPNLAERNVTATARIHHADYGTARCDVDVSGRESRWLVPLVRTGIEADQRSVKGVVVAPDGKPVAGAVIHCDSVRTPGMGLISPIDPHGTGLTDDEGRFTFYLPNVNRKGERGDLIPPNSRYALTITGPAGESYFPVAGNYPNTGPVRIEMPRPTRMHRLRVEAPGGGRVEDPEQLRQIYVQYYYSDRDGDRAFVLLDSMSVFRGRRLPSGKYRAERYVNGKIFRYQPLIIAPDSSAELVFQLPPPVTYQGRVVHGVTGQPIAGAFLMGWHAIAQNNLALLTADDWKLLHDLSAAPELEDPAVDPLRKLYGVQGLVRTNGEGRFEITRQPDQDFYGLLAFEEGFVPYKIRLGSLPADERQRIDAGEFPLFPAAKVLVRPVFDGKNLAVSPKWLPDETGQPDWLARFQTAGKGSDREFEYVHWLKLNEMQAIYVPAGVRLRLRFETPYADEWVPANIKTPLRLQPGETREIGDLHFAASLPAIVRVVDGKGKPVEGAPVRRMYVDGQAWSVAHNTDKEGLAHFHVHPASKGKFRVFDLPGPGGDRLVESLVTAFEVGEQAPAKRFEFILTDDQVRSLRGDPQTPGRVGK